MKHNSHNNINALIVKGLEMIGAQELLNQEEVQIELSSIHSRTQEYRSLIVLGITTILLSSVYPILAASTYRSSADLHAAIEMAGAVLGVISGVSFIARFYVLADRFHLLIGLAFLVNAIADFVYGFFILASHHGWLVMTPETLSQFTMGTYVTGRLFMGIMLIIAAWFGHRLGQSLRPRQETFWAALAAFMVTILGVMAMWLLPLAKFSYPEHLIARPVDFLSGMILATALALFLKEYHQGRDMMTWWIAFSITINVVGQLMLSFSKTLNDAFADTAHVYKLLGYGVPLLGFSLYQIAAIMENTRAKRVLDSVLTYMMAYIDDKTKTAARLACGDLRDNVTPRSDQDVLGVAFRQMLTSHREMAIAATHLAQGDLAAKVTPRSEHDGLGKALHLLIAAMQEVTQLAQAIADGNLTVVLQERSEQDMLISALNAMTQRLKEMMMQVQTTAEMVATASRQMCSAAEHISHGASQQAATTEEVSSSMEQMTANISQNADNASQNEQFAAQAAEEAREGGQAVAQTVAAMKTIVKKINLIEDITRQTHMLSLNATIEAAKAEDSGKGFAVVAAEVRSLAQRSRNAAEEIRDLADSSVTIAEKAGVMLEKLVPNIQKTAELVQEISVASHEQRVGAEQVSTAMQQVDQIIQQNVTTLEQMASITKELASQAELLQQAIAYFKVA